MRRLSFFAAVFLLTTAAGGVSLPWFENYFFPLSAWISPDLACIPDSEDPSEPLIPHTWAEWNARFAEINCIIL